MTVRSKSNAERCTKKAHSTYGPYQYSHRNRLFLFNNQIFHFRDQ
jgi:hypothetical protein